MLRLSASRTAFLSSPVAAGRRTQGNGLSLQLESTECRHLENQVRRRPGSQPQTVRCQLSFGGTGQVGQCIL